MCVAELSRRALELDAAAAHALNVRVRRSRRGQQLASAAAGGLASAEVALMLALAFSGQWRTALRMLFGVGTVYAACEGLGLVWRRERPFSGVSEVQELIEHRPGRSFPSRHVASGLAMAAIGAGASARLGAVMAVLAWLLGVSRVAAGLHYPSDVVAGALLGHVIGRCWRYGRGT